MKNLFKHFKKYKWSSNGEDFDWEIIKVITEYFESKNLINGRDFSVIHEPKGKNSYPDIELKYYGKSYFFECKTGASDSSILLGNTIPGTSNVIYLIRTYGKNSIDFTYVLDKDIINDDIRKSLIDQKINLLALNKKNKDLCCGAYVYSRPNVKLSRNITKYTKDPRRSYREYNVENYIRETSK